MVGCRHNAKNTLMKNYLHLALGLGARIYALTTARAIEARDDGDFDVRVRRSGWGRKEKTIRARNLVVAAGVLGTLRLLLSPENRLPRLSARLGRDVRTNSEVLSGATALSAKVDYSEGLAITAGMRPDEQTSVEAVRYSSGSDAMSLLAVRDVPGATRAERLLRLAWRFASRPLETARLSIPLGWARRSTILLFMQTADSRLRVALKGRRLASRAEDGAAAPPRDFPAAARVLARFAEKTGSVAQSCVAGPWLGVSTTAHILGGAVIGSGPEAGVVGLDGRAFGHENLWILDGSIVPGNLGVNPSLTITALAEHALSLVPPNAVPGR
jgi:cholesterol oxidase